MATRGHLGGLARATSDAALVLDAAGKDVVLIETVGVGQDEVDIVRTADVSIVTLVPGAGDDVQALKAGIMEIADIFVVNKADRDGADRTVTSIEAMLSLQTYAAGELAAADRQDRGDDRQAASPSCSRRIDAFRAHSAGTPGSRRRARGASSGCASCWPTGSSSMSNGACSSPARSTAMLDRIARRELDPYTAADAILQHGAASEPRRRGAAMKAALDHIGIAVSNLDAALAFYRDALGLEVEPPRRCLAAGPRALHPGGRRRRSSCSRRRPRIRRSRSTSRSAAPGCTTSRSASTTSRRRSRS